ncbi:nicotinate-nucleotide--dimethylbenzimidazole phosphoribosyltransferase [Streptomyces subrutilus]|uniref:Nicotinate-nucleotide--dimethylbenzimidazole phosphoribosyltransferase n=1 Tax=Streptomyces subrutilus TaxID=36818 RepID=A0A1E5PNS1_9ACTN|nr:nicotinate-nucleotide--dimethylbenzimidazole phosphoribosyltransferase [Streptomyces subrutilus]OEJ31198.1 5,6-dimethylbenzimidazole synthase [Streptomyces subrutilus]
MTDTGQVPGEGHPDNAGMVDQQGIPAQVQLQPPLPAGYAFQDLVDDPAGPEDEELLLMPSGQGAWSDPQVVPPAPAFPVEPSLYGDAPYGTEPAYQEAPAYHEPAAYPEFPSYGAGAHETGGRDSGALDLGGLVVPPPAAPAQAAPAAPVRRPLHMGPPVPEATGGVVRSLADRGPAAAPAPVRRSGPPATGPEYLDLPAAPAPQLTDIPPQAGAPWAPEPAPVAVPAPEAAEPEAQPEAQPEPQPVAVPEPEPVVAAAQEPVAAVVPEAEPVVAVVQEPVAPAVPEPVVAAAPEPVLAAVPEPVVAAAPEPVLAAVPEPVVAAAPEPEAAPAPVAEPEPAPAPVPVEAAAPEPQPEPEFVPAPAPAEAVVPAPEHAQALAEPFAGPTPAEAAQPEPAQPEAAAAEPAALVTPAPVPAQPEAAAAEPAALVTPAPVPAQPEAPAAEPQPAAAEPVPAEPVPAAPAEPLAAAPAEPVTVEPLAAEPVHAQAPAETEPVEAEPPAAEAETEAQPEFLPAEPAAGDPAPAYDDAEREAVLRVMRERRDIRKGFRTDPIPHEVLLRVLEAAHTAPSVGHSQPWDFVVIRSAETRRTMHELAQRQREAYANSLPKARAKQFKELKIEAILDTPVNIVVTADPTRGGRHTLGRHTQPQMAPYSSALAVENLWLAARAEGLGVGWVSFFDEREMVRALGLPEHLEVVAYLCVGYVDEFPEEPELAQAGWSQRRPLSWVVHEETYGRRALPGEEPHDLLSETVAGIRPLDAKALGEAWERQKRMTKPAGALGMLEIISAQLSGLSRVCPPPIPEPAAVAIFAGDHGVHAQGVTPWPQEVTTQMVANFLGGGAVCNAFANQVGAEVCVIDVGVAGDLPATPGLLPRKVRPGTADLSTGPAMTREEAVAAIEVGIETARDLVAAGNKALLTGEMGIANTTVSAALISVFTGVDPAEVTGRGTGINDETHARKVEVVRRALDLHQPDPADPIGVLAAVGGLEHAAIVGLLLGGASLRTPVILDGVSAGAAALVARAIAPEALSACIAGHRSAEPGHVAALNKLGLRPLVDLDLRLGEGTGALLALPLVQSAARAMHEVATFDSAGVTEK